MSDRSTYADQVTTFLASVATRNRSLLDAFNRLVNAFNHRDFQTVDNMLDDNVTLTTLDPPVTKTPKSQVAPYIPNKIANDDPIFIPLPPINVNSTTGLVWGKATWLDNDNGAPTSSIIFYWFTFILHSDGLWYVLYLAGTPD
jgi:hypothetical protein